MHFRQIANLQMKMARLKSGDLQPLCKMPSPSSFFFLEILFRGTPSRAANRSRAKQPAVVSRSPIPAPNSRTVPIVSCTVRRSRSQYRSPVPLVPVHRTSSSYVGHQFVVVQVRPLAPVPISIRSCSPSVSSRRHQFVVKAGRRHQSSRCSSRAAEFREANMGSRVPENGSSRTA